MGKIPNCAPVIIRDDCDKSGTVIPDDIRSLIEQLNDMCPNGEEDLLVVFTDGEK